MKNKKRLFKKESLKEKVFEIVKMIPSGKVMTYKDIANQLKTSPRVIGRILSKNVHPIKIPCHRVIRSNMKVGGYTFKGNFFPELKIKLLKKEGIKILKGKVIFKFIF